MTMEIGVRNGSTDVAGAKVVAVATALQMRARPPARPAPTLVHGGIRHVPRPEAGWYRDVFRRVGEPWLWAARLGLAPDALEAIIRAPDVEVWSFAVDGRDEGLLELDFRKPGECEIVYFGMTSAWTGRGIGRALMHHAIERAWRRPIGRLWVHTCTLDHPGALAFYIRSGFEPFKRMIAVMDDPRLDGTLSPDAAPHVPIIAHQPPDPPA